MLRNYLKIAFRNLFKEKVFAFINIFGLAVGVTAFLLILQFVVFERSYDKFHDDAENIYRVQLNQYKNNELMMKSAENYPGAALALQDEYPEVIAYSRLYNLGYKNNIVITYEDAPNGPVQFKHRRFLYADSSFLPMFGYKLAAGNARTALSKPNSAAISATYAKKYFGITDPIGKFLRLQDDDYNDETCKVTAVFEDLPNNTHLKFDVLFSYKTLYSRGDWAPERYNTTWRRKDMYSFIKVLPGTNPIELEAKFPAVVKKYMPGDDPNMKNDELKLQALTAIHLTSNLADEAETNGDADKVLYLTVVGFFILIIAWVNYINLSTAKAMERAGEVGVRKSLGAYKSQLVNQFMIESAIVNLLAIMLALLLFALCLPVFNRIVGVETALLHLMQPWFLISLVLLWVFGTLLSGIYPSFILSSFRPVVVLKGKLRHKGNSVIFRKSLVVFQFVSSIILIAGTLIIYQQIRHMMNLDIGMNIEQVLTVERPSVSPSDSEQRTNGIEVFRDELLKYPAIKAVAGSVTVPGKKREYKVDVKKYGAGDDDAVLLRWNSMDDHFNDVFKMEVLAGRLFSKEFTNDDDTSVVVSLSSAKLLGFENPEDAVGQTLAITQFQWNPIIVGVVNDYHQESLKKVRDPMIFYCSYTGAEFYSMSISTENLSQTIAHIETSWEKAFPGNPFDFFFLDDYFNRQYEKDQNFGNLFALFAIVALLVGCLGLYGLSAYTAQQKTKEIGVRKVMGSSINGILMLLSKEFLLLIVVACLIGIPAVYFIMDNWLQDFAIRVNVDWILLLLSSALVIIVAVVAMGYQTMKAARLNPVDSLKYE